MDIDIIIEVAKYVNMLSDNKITGKKFQKLLMNALQEQFVLFSKFGDPRSDGKTMTLSQSDKWMKQAHIIDGKTITLTETGVAFNKFRSRTINYYDYMKFVEDLAHSTGNDVDDFKTKMVSCGPPGVSKITANPTPKDKN